MKPLSPAEEDIPLEDLGEFNEASARSGDGGFFVKDDHDMELRLCEEEEGLLAGESGEDEAGADGSADGSADVRGDGRAGGNGHGDDENEDYDETEFLRFRLSEKNRFFRLCYHIWYGPVTCSDDPPRRIESLLALEKFPGKFRNRVPRHWRVIFLSVYLLVWFILSYGTMYPYLTKPPQFSGKSNVDILTLSCHSDSAFWRGKNGACGLDGKRCPTIDTGKDVYVRCPALCDRESYTFSFIPVGDQQIKYRGYFVGGGPKTQEEGSDTISYPYRGDSFPCGAAVHAGVVSPFFGGCARVKFTGGQLQFPSRQGKYGTGDSISFLSFFKSSFAFKPLKTKDEQGRFSHCNDPRLLVLIMNIILGLPIVYLASGAAAYWVTNTVGFWTICLATDPPVTADPHDLETFAKLLSIGFQRFLPSAFIMYVLWHASVKRTLTDPPNECNIPPSPLHKLVFWYPLTWLGILNNVTFDRLPVDRLTLNDVKRVATLISVLALAAVILVCAVRQAYSIWLSGRLRKYLGIYALFIAGLVFLISLPGLNLRIHHYILALLLIPGCSTRGRTALAFQGILMGLFLSGASRWGLDSIVETGTSLLRDDPVGAVLPPMFIGYDKITNILTWDPMSSQNALAWVNGVKTTFDGFSLLINDIERYAGTLTSLNLPQLFANTSDLQNSIQQALVNGYKDKNGDILIYLRIGLKILGEKIYSDFSKAAILKWPSGDFVKPDIGLT